MKTTFKNEALTAIAVNENHSALNGKQATVTYRDRHGITSRNKGLLIGTQCASGRMRLGFKIAGYEDVEIVSPNGETNSGVVALSLNADSVIKLSY